MILSWCDDPADPQYEISREAWETLVAARDSRGRSLAVHKIHQPAPMHITPAEALTVAANPEAKHRHEGRRLGGSYVNFYIANRAIIMPVFDDEAFDGPARSTLQRLFPDREVVPLPGREILLGGGNIHCITQQQPRVSAAASSI